MYISIISKNTSFSEKQVKAVISLLDDGASIPFIARYRKERTEGLDEVQIASIKENYEKIQVIEKRKKAILKSIEEQGKLTKELASQINNSWDINEIEDLYLPYKPKRRTRAEIARELGLEPLAKILMAQHENNVEKAANSFVKGTVKTIDEALQGARDIVAEWISENARVRNAMRNIFEREAFISSKVVKGKEKEGEKYQDYFDTKDLLRKCSSHRLLAMRRGENEGFLKVTIAPDEDKTIESIEKIVIKGFWQSSEQVRMALVDSYKRLLRPSIETEFASISKAKADDEAIKVFVENLRQLLLASPLGQKRILALDPGFRTGCKVVCLDAQGNLIHNETIYPHPPQNEIAQATRKIQKMVEAYDIQAIAIGNGTASRETERFIQNVRYDRKVQIFVVSENGASIYSASKVAREEFPDYDVTVRGAVSIGRRLMDPLAELVKIDPKSIGVGQYQHDVDQTKLKSALDQTVESCVNLVGVDLNTASKHLLTHISGLGPQLAQNIVDYRKENGAFVSRKQLLNVPKMGAKTYEQCAGFLRISNGENPLDNSSVHPESYKIVEKIAKDQNLTIKELIGNKSVIDKIDLSQYVTPLVGIPTLKDIMKELEKPGRDPRQIIKVFEFDPNVKTIEDLKIGMELPGIVTNITNFGAFVDVGVKENGLIHISQLSDNFVSNPADIISLHQHIRVRVLSVDFDRKRIQLKKVDNN